MRVAIFAESYLPYVSGVTISTDALTRGLAAAGHDVLLVAPRPAGMSAEPQLNVAWLPSYQLPWLVPPSYRMPLPLAWRDVGRRVDAFAPDVIHAQSPFVSGFLAWRLARRLGVPLVFTHHTRFGDYGHYLGPFAAPGAFLTDAYLRTFWSRCAAIVAPSQDLARDIEARLSDARLIVRVIPTGLDLGAIASIAPSDPRALAGWPADALIVASLGRLAREKSVVELMDATVAAFGRESRLRLLLIGGGPLESTLHRRAALMGDRVFLTGAMDRAPALAQLKGSDLFAFASQTETQGLVLAEALACGLPVVARQGPAVGETARDGVDGLIVPDLPLLTEALLALAIDAERRMELSRQARAGAARFDRSRRIDEMVDLYGEVMAASARYQHRW